MTFEYIKHRLGAEVESDLKSIGPWTVATIDQTIGWPKESIAVTYDGVEFYILGYEEDDKDILPAVAIKSKSVSDQNAKNCISEFLSLINWVNSGSIRTNFSFGSTRVMRSRSSSKSVRHVTDHFYLDYLPSNLSDDAKLALALLREGDYLRHTHRGYSFLSYFKIINIIYNNGRRQKDWIKNEITNLQDKGAVERAKKIIQSGKEIEEYLYHSCRCAIAHAGIDPTVNPDDSEDDSRLKDDICIIRELAVIAIKDNYGVKTIGQYWEQHLYELHGFKQYLGEDFVDIVLAENIVGRRTLRIIDKIAARQRHDKKYGVFENLNLRTKRIRDGVVHLECYSDDMLFKVPLYLDFNKEICHFDVERALISHKEKRGLEYQIDYWNFMKDLLCNGQIEIWVAGSDALLSRKDPNLSYNIDLMESLEAMDRSIDQIQLQIADF